MPQTNRFGQYLVTLAIVGVYLAHYAGIGPVWDTTDSQLQNLLLMAVVGYWLGSSDGSARKSETIRTQNQEVTANGTQNPQTPTP